MILKEERGDLFELDSKYALAHCISLDCKMGAGIAVEFDKRFPEMKQTLLNAIKERNPYTITTIAYKHKVEDEKIIFNLITKEHYYDKPTYLSIHMCIKKMVHMCKYFNIKHLAMPKIGCGLDKLRWDKVKGILEHEFKDMDIEIVVRYL